MTVEVIPIVGMPEIKARDDLVRLLLDALPASSLTLQAGDVLVVTQKAVSKAEGRVVPEQPLGKAGWIEKEAKRVVARRAGLLIAETRHGFVCANAGVDASNISEGFLALLPEDPDGSAERLRDGIRKALGVEVGVVITDTFGRPWRRGLVNVAIGCAGLPALIDLRGTQDAAGRTLEATVVALADEISAASGLVMTKAGGIPMSVIRGLPTEGEPTKARDLVRPPEEDLFRTGTIDPSDDPTDTAR